MTAICLKLDVAALSVVFLAYVLLMRLEGGDIGHMTLKVICVITLSIRSNNQYINMMSVCLFVF